MRETKINNSNQIKGKKDMRLNGGLLSSETSEWVKLRQAWKKWNASCHPDDQIDWIEFLEEHS